MQVRSIRTLPIARPSATCRKRLGGFGERVHRADVRRHAAASTSSSRSSRSLRANSSGGTSWNWKPEHVNALDQHQIQRDAGDHAGGEPDGDEAAAAAQRPQCGLGQLTADRVDHHVGAARDARRAARRAGRPSRWLIRLLGAVIALPLELFGRRRDGGDRGAERDAELDCRQADAAARAEHDQLVAVAAPAPPTAARDTPCGTPRRMPPRCARRRRRVSVPARPRAPRPPRRMRRTSRCRSPGRRPRNPCTPHRSRRHAGELAARYERRRHADLVLVRDQQHVGEVDRRRVDPHPTCPAPAAGAGRSSMRTTSGGPYAGQTAARMSASPGSRWTRRVRPPTPSGR